MKSRADTRAAPTNPVGVTDRETRLGQIHRATSFRSTSYHYPPIGLSQASYVSRLPHPVGNEMDPSFP